MAIDEKKLLEALEKLPYINGNYDKENANLLFICGAESFHEMVVDLINEQPKISLENKTSDKTSDWIPVEEALPRENEDVLVTERHKDTNRTFVNLITYYSMDYRNDTKFEIIAWQPLPKAYKSEE